MLRHLGTKRTPGHNLKLATLVGLTAGFVNAEGFLGFAVLTTNVTGHAALFAQSIEAQDWRSAQMIALWMALFLAGAFFSGMVLSVIGADRRYSYAGPVLTEIAILLFAAIYGHRYTGSIVSKEIFGGSLLFAMGLQNALVSMISGSVVRTTHLTGTFTDLGIELAQFSKSTDINRKALKGKIRLRIFLILFFMAGAVGGAYLFKQIRFYAFFAPAGILVFVLFYDIMRIKAIHYYHAIRSGKHP